MVYFVKCISTLCYKVTGPEQSAPLNNVSENPFVVSRCSILVLCDNMVNGILYFYQYYHYSRYYYHYHRFLLYSSLLAIIGEQV